ncbi:hypothetical protein NPIL_506891 [Nephila pilipes]|uniref:Uncharacterized protein n=1 Tax=Nephila pilipes TaxID=299642 RepID=A0A8X6Q6H5_NEPPI|nr:hypothetical protein NPIL_506891 [Nephila pilipes]
MQHPPTFEFLEFETQNLRFNNRPYLDWRNFSESGLTLEEDHLHLDEHQSLDREHLVPWSTPVELVYLLNEKILRIFLFSFESRTCPSLEGKFLSLEPMAFSLHCRWKRKLYHQFEIISYVLHLWRMVLNTGLNPLLCVRTAIAPIENLTTAVWHIAVLSDYYLS